MNVIFVISRRAWIFEVQANLGPGPAIAVKDVKDWARFLEKLRSKMEFPNSMDLKKMRPP